MSVIKNRLVQPYLFFNGRCEEAVRFYEKAIGARPEMVMKYKDSPEKPPPGMLPPGFEDKVMHTSFWVGDSMVMASDGCEATLAQHNGFSLALSVPTEADAEKVFAGLSEGGVVEMPLTKTFWSPKFGMLKDKFGIGWMIMVPQEMPPQ